MSQQSANRYPKEQERVVVDKTHTAHGGKRGVVEEINDNASGPWYTIRFDRTPGNPARKGVVHGNYLIVEKAANIQVDMPVRRAPYQEGRETT